MLAQFQTKPSRGKYELECRFEQGTGKTYLNVVRYLMWYGFNPVGKTNLMRISYDDHVRAELRGEAMMRDYGLTKLLPEGATIERKLRVCAEPISDLFVTKMALSTEEEAPRPEGEPTHFRSMNRISFHDPSDCYRVDCTIVRQGNHLSEVVGASFTYEIEVEFLKPNKTNQTLVDTAVRHVLRGLQDSHYPISKGEMDNVRLEYFQIMVHLGMMKASTPKAKDVAFLAPKPVTLQPSDVNQLSDYMVTRKTDGSRKLLLVSKTKRVYLLSSGNVDKMTVQFTGTTADMKPTLLDGEHVTRVSTSYVKTCNSYHVFDCYLANGEPTVGMNLKTRMFHAETMVQLIRMVDVDEDEFKKLEVCIKAHEDCTPAACQRMMGKYFKDFTGNDYNVDGLIFTPLHPITSFHTAYQVYKWKPAEDNTVDFLVTFSRDDLLTLDKTRVQLFVNYLPKSDHGKCSRYATLVGIAGQKSKEYHQLSLVPFNPTMMEPVYIEVDIVNNNVYTELHEVVEPGSVVECSFDGHQWVMQRMRWDKMGITPQPNMMATAMSVWSSIQDPITPDMLITPASIRTGYFVKPNVGKDALRSFHNAVKHQLIDHAMKHNKKYTVLDFAVGRGGDLFKYGNRTSLLVGIDLDHTNIFSQVDGCGLRYVQSKMTDKQVPDRALFLHGNSGLSFETGDSFFSPVDKQLFRGITMEGEPRTFPNVPYGAVVHGFDVTSIQFALHYMVASTTMMNQFLDNVATYTAPNGSFIATCFHGAKVEALLSALPFGETHTIPGVCSITKWYADTDECKKITVKQGTIGKAYDEWLVPLDKLVDAMGLRGFSLEEHKPFQDYNGFHSLSAHEKTLSALNMTLHFKKCT